MSKDEIYLKHILACIDRIEENVSVGREAFMVSHTLQDAVLHNLQTIAESTKRISGEAKQGYPDIPWREIAGFRNVIVHDYLSVDLDVVWSIVQRDVPQLEQTVRKLLGNQ